MSDDEVEKAILFYMIFQGEECTLSEKDFFNPIHKKIIQAINELKSKKEKVSIITLNNRIQTTDSSIITYLSKLGDYISFTEFDTAHKLLKKYTKKRQIQLLSKVIDIEIKDVDEVDTYVEKIISKLQKIEFQTGKDESFSNQLINNLNLIEKKLQEKTEDYSLYTGFFDLDALTDGLHNGELTVIGARPRNRKNNFCITSS